MAFRLRIERVTYLSKANIWALDGKLLDGVVRNGAVAVARTASGTTCDIRIQNGAMVDPAPLVDRSLVTLVIDEPPCPVEELEGSLLIGAERTTDSASEPSTAKKTVGGS